MTPNPKFRTQLAGKSFAALRHMLSDDARNTVPTAVRVPEGSEKLAVSLLRCALKTIAVTDVVWREELEEIRAKRAYVEVFPNAREAQRVPVPVSELETRLKNTKNALVLPKNLEVYRVKDDSAETIGLMLRTECDLTDQPVGFFWTVDLKGEIKSVHPADWWPDDETREAFHRLKKDGQCATAADMMASEVRLVAELYLKD